MVHSFHNCQKHTSYSVTIIPLTPRNVLHILPLGKKEVFIKYILTEMVICYAVFCSYDYRFLSDICVCN